MTSRQNNPDGKSGDVKVNPDTLEAFAKDLLSQADEVASWRKQYSGVVDALTADTKRDTTDNEVPPIYQPTVTAATEALQTLNTKSQSLEQNLRGDAAEAIRYAKEMRELAESGKKSIESVAGNGTNPNKK